MILLVESIWVDRVEGHTVRVVTVLRVLHRQKIGGDSLVQRLPGGAGVHALEEAACGQTDVKVGWIPGIHKDGVGERPAGRPPDKALPLFQQLEIVQEPRHRFPGYATVL
jgi:hypothetical protein